MTVFGSYSKYYNLLYKDKDYAGETEYVHALIQKYHPRSKNILDLGCGTGRHDFLLAQNGYSVTGVDMSEEMLAVANSQLSTLSSQPSTIRFIKGDICTVRMDLEFDAVLSLFHVMSYQITNELLRNAISNSYRHLKSGGIFIFDFWYGPAVLTDIPTVRVKRLEDEDLSIYRIATPVMHMNESIVDVNYEVLIEYKETKTLDKLKETHRMRYFFLPELEFMLKSEGFRIIADLAWMRLDKKLSSDSWNGVLIARK